jgi:phosphoglycolate phosphatase-like HAD superfamily hydrolase
MIRAVIFDLDGTLGDTLPLCIKAFRASIEPLASRTLSDAEIIATFGPSEEGTIRMLIPEHYDRGLAAYLQGYAAMHDSCPTPFPGIPELLRSLRQKGVRIAMVTGKGPHTTAITLDRFGLTSFFEQVETGSPEGPVKAEGIAAVLKSWKGITRQEVIYVGDAPSDVTASRHAGVAVVGAAWAPGTNAGRLEAAQPDKLFYSVGAFSKWMETVIPSEGS